MSSSIVDKLLWVEWHGMQAFLISAAVVIDLV